MTRCGTPTGYVNGCRCQACSTAHRDYNREWERRKRRVAYGIEQAYVPYVDCTEARQHLIWLQQQGIGKRTVSEVSGIAQSTIDKIRTGKRHRAKPDTITRILAVGTHRTQAGASIDAAPTWRYINDLLELGFTKTRIAHELGRTTPALQINRQRVRKSTADKIRNVWFKLCQETEPWHGTYYGYSRKKCRCLRCTESARINSAEQRARSKAS